MAAAGSLTLSWNPNTEIDLILLGLSTLKPFAFSFDPGFLSERLSSLNLMPLLPYFHRTDLGAPEYLVKTFLYPLPLYSGPAMAGEGAPGARILPM